MGKETEGRDGLNAELNYTRDLRHVLANARIGWALEKQAAVAAAVAAEREAERARCCADICDHCADGIPIKRVGEQWPSWLHDMRELQEPGGDPYEDCKAAAIRARASGGNGEGD